MMPKNKHESLSTLIKKLDTQISLFVRLSAADESGRVECISCGQKLFWKEADCCHYRDRNNMSTRFYLPNLSPGCQSCNRFNHYEHLAEWRKKLTTEERCYLYDKSRDLQKWTRPELEEMLSDYTEKVKNLKKQKGL